MKSSKKLKKVVIKTNPIAKNLNANKPKIFKSKVVYDRKRDNGKDCDS